jgi:hypothetical protein
MNVKTGYCAHVFGLNTGCYNFPGSPPFPITKCVCDPGYICWDNHNNNHCELSDDLYTGTISSDRLIPNTTNLTLITAAQQLAKDNYTCILKTLDGTTIEWWYREKLLCEHEDFRNKLHAPASCNSNDNSRWSNVYSSYYILNIVNTFSYRK